MIGGLIVVYRHAWAERHRHAVVAFAAGVLISLTFLEILPEAFENGYKGGVFAVLGFVGMYCLEHLFSAHRHVDEHCLEVRASRIAYVGLVVHSLVDGLALAAGFELNSGFGWLVAAGVVLHEVPEGLASGSLLICSGVKRAP